jgi:hypothetical protein
MVAMVLLAVPTQAYFVAGGYNVALESSDSGATWTPQMTTSTNARFNGVAYGAGTWVAVGQSGAAFTSPTGDTWTQQTTGTTGTFNAIAFGVVSGNPMFAAVGANSNNVQMIYTSPNGVTWSAVPTPLPYNAVLNGITYGTPGGTGTFVAVGYGGLALTSTDGTTWNPQNTNGMPSVPPSTTTPPTLRAIAWGGNQFVTVGDSGVVKTSPDGVVWTQQTSGTTVVLWAVATSGTQWVAGGNNGVLLSSTNGGTTWTPATQLLPTPNYSTSHYWYGLAYGNGRWVAVSNSMYANSTTYSSPVVTSTDGLNWQYRPATGYYFYGPRAVAYANGQFVAAGYYNLLRSSNGLDWIVEHTMAQNFYTFGIAYSVTQDRGAQWVAVGYYGGTAYTSTNGHDWVARYTGVQWAYFYDIAWGAGRYVALDVYGNSITSTDGITWERVNGMGSNLYSIAFRAGQWMAVGYGGAVRVSEDGINWSAGSSPGSYYLYGVVWGGGNWTVVGGNGAILTSPDGITWTRRTSPTSQWLYDIAYDANAPAAKWVAIGYNTVVTSSNGVTWSLANTGVPSGSSLYRVDRDGTNWVAVATYPYGLSIRSPDAVTWSSTTTVMPGASWYPQYSLAADRLQPLHCLPETQIVGLNAPARVAAGGGRWPYTWSAPQSTNIAGFVQGAAIKPRYATENTYNVFVTDAAGTSKECEVVVMKNPPPKPAGPLPACGYSITTTTPGIPNTIEDPTLFEWEEILPSRGGTGNPMPSNFWYDRVMGFRPAETFAFSLCGREYTNFRLAAAGQICMEQNNVAHGSVTSVWWLWPSYCGYYWATPIPGTSVPNGAVYGSQNLLNPVYCSGGSSNCLAWQLKGTAPNRVLIYEFRDVPHYMGAQDQSFQIKLFEASDCIEVHYINVSGNTLQWENAYPMAAGYEDASGNLGWQYAFHGYWSGSWEHKNQAWRACPFGAANDKVTANEDVPLTFDPGENDNGAGETFSVTAYTQGTKGTVTPGPGPRLLTYSPKLDQVGLDTFTYTIGTASGKVSTGKVTVNITKVNDAPFFLADDTPIVTTPSEGTITRAGWGRDVRPGPVTAADETPQGVTFKVTVSNPGIFKGLPTVVRTGGVGDTLSGGPYLGDYAALSFTPSGVPGSSKVCVAPVDSGGRDTTVDTAGESATGVDTGLERCVDVVENAPPVAFFEPSTDTARPGERVGFDPCPRPIPDCSHDPDGAIADYLWEFGDGATSSQVTPSHSYTRLGTFEARLTVWDSFGVQDSATRTITIEAEDGAGKLGGDDEAVAAPTADAGSDRTVLEGTEVRLDGSQRGGDANAKPEWSQLSGPPLVLAGADTFQPAFTAPRLPSMEPVELVFGLRVAQGPAVSASDYVVIRVVSANHAPVADAGETRTALPGAAVRIEATGTDEDNDPLTYRWEQVLVPGEQLVTLQDPSSPELAFTAPSAPGVLHFRLTVSDGKAASQDTVVVQVQPQASAAAAGAGAPVPDASRDVPLGLPARAGPNWLLLGLAALAFAALALGAVALVVRRLRQ